MLDKVIGGYIFTYDFWHMKKIIKYFRNIFSFPKGDFQEPDPSPEHPSPHKIAEKKVFLSYAKEDGETAYKLYNDLKNADVAVWMDIADILPGEKWRTKIIQVIKESSHFLALLSSRSYSKKGFVQKELKIALDLLDEHPPSQVFLIPIRINDFEPYDEKLKELHWVDLFPSYKDGLNKILHVLSGSELLLDLRDTDIKEPRDLLSELSEWKSIHNNSQLLVNSLNTPLNFMTKYRFTNDTDWLEEAGYKWRELCVPMLKSVDEWEFQQAHTPALDDLREQISPTRLKEISRLLMQPDIQRTEFNIMLSDIKELNGSLWNLLSVADKKITKLVETLIKEMTHGRL